MVAPWVHIVVPSLAVQTADCLPDFCLDAVPPILPDSSHPHMPCRAQVAQRSKVCNDRERLSNDIACPSFRPTGLCVHALGLPIPAKEKAREASYRVNQSAKTAACRATRDGPQQPEAHFNRAIRERWLGSR